MAALPQFVVLQSKFNSKNLQFVSEEGDLHGYIQSSGDAVVSPFTKLQIEVSQSDSNLVHVKNCYNNKYWVASSQEDNWIVAGANEPDEDTTKLSCTLFRPTFVNATTVRLIHVNLKKVLSLKTPASQNKDVLILCPQSESENEDLSDAFTVFNWSSIILLPRNLGLKVHSEDNSYLIASPVDYNNYMKFIGDDEWSPAVRQEVSVAGDGCVMVKSVHYNKYWARDYSSIIIARGDYTPSDQTLQFRPESVGAGANVIGLRGMTAGKDYCKKLVSTTDEKLTNVISAADATITDRSKLEVIELVTAKLVDNVDFKTLDAKINDTEDGAFDTQEAINRSQTDETDKVLNFSWKSNSSTWTSIANGSLKVGEKIGISSQIPAVDNGNIIFPSDYEGDIAWGVAQLVTGSEESAKFTVKRLPAKTKVTVTAMGDLNSCEVPFSYIQTNTVNPDGTTDSFDMEDGKYVGVNCGSFKNSYEVEIALLA